MASGGGHAASGQGCVQLLGEGGTSQAICHWGHGGGVSTDIGTWWWREKKENGEVG